MSALSQKRTSRSNRNALLDTRTVHFVELVVASRHKLSFEFWGFIRVPRIERWRRVVLYPELNFSCRRLACNFGDDAKRKIYACCDSTPGNHVAIFHHSCLFVCSSYEWQKFSIGPVCCGPAPFQETSHTQNECARANRRDVLCDTCLVADEVDSLAVVYNAGHAFASPRYADQVERRAARKGVRRDEAK